MNPEASKEQSRNEILLNEAQRKKAPPKGAKDVKSGKRDDGKEEDGAEARMKFSPSSEGDGKRRKCTELMS